MKLITCILGAIVVTLVIFGMVAAIFLTIVFCMDEPLLLFALAFLVCVIITTIKLYNEPQ
jgi:hypothetical protein